MKSLAEMCADLEHEIAEAQADRARLLAHPEQWLTGPGVEANESHLERLQGELAKVTVLPVCRCGHYRHEHAAQQFECFKDCPCGEYMRRQVQP